MISRRLINRIIILSFFVLIGYCLAVSVASRNFIGMTLAVVALGAGIRFLYLLAKQQEEAETEGSHSYQES